MHSNFCFPLVSLFLFLMFPLTPCRLKILDSNFDIFIVFFEYVSFPYHFWWLLDAFIIYTCLQTTTVIIHPAQLKYGKLISLYPPAFLMIVVNISSTYHNDNIIFLFSAIKHNVENTIWRKLFIYHILLIMYFLLIFKDSIFYHFCLRKFF